MHNWGIIGHSWAIESLRSSIVEKRIAHAYLISGTAQLGKALLALRIAQALNCNQAQADPCLECRSCRRIERGNHPDVRIAGMATQTAGLKPEEALRQRDLRIDTIREWQRDITLRPYEGQQRVFILHDAERLNDASSNAMLKTLEEPPPYATLILVANTAGDLLPTIVSRCRPLKLRLVPRAEISQALQERYNLSSSDAHMLAAWSAGRPGWAIHMVQSPEALEERQTQLDSLAALTELPLSQSFRWAEEQAKQFRSDQREVYALLELWQSWWRDVLMLAAGCEQAIVFVDRRSELEHYARRYPLADIHACVQRIGAASQRMRENLNPQLALEHVLLHMPVQK